jgi:riboflavin biosynthesis pyrimidine reductase
MRYFNSLDGLFDSMYRELNESFKNLSDVRIVREKNRTFHYKNGLVHREDGPAVITRNSDGSVTESYYLNGICVQKEDLDKLKQKLEDEQIHEIWVDGRRYEVTGKKLKEVMKVISDK